MSCGQALAEGLAVLRREIRAERRKKWLVFFCVPHSLCFSKSPTTKAMYKPQPVVSGQKQQTVAVKCSGCLLHLPAEYIGVCRPLPFLSLISDFLLMGLKLWFGSF